MLQALLRRLTGICPVYPEKLDASTYIRKEPLCIGEIKGQSEAKIGLLIAAAGRHNVLLIGPPGEGKSTIASTLPGFLPDISGQEYHDLCFNTERNVTPIEVDPVCRPFIEVSPNITESALLGGGRRPLPGAISLAHSGVLFMDEFPYYKRSILESLRTPLEREEIVISRGGEQVLFKCNFQLVAAMNPCSCGYFGTPKCTCELEQVLKFNEKLSGPIVDRIDMFLRLDKLGAEDRFKASITGQSQYYKRKVENAILFRLNNRQQEYANKQIHSKHVFSTTSDIIKWSECGLELFKLYLDRDGFTTRKGVRLARLARTMADLLEHPLVEAKHLYMVEDYTHAPNPKGD